MRLDRMRSAAVLLALAAGPAAAAGAVAVVAPTEGPLAILGRQVVDGARFAARAAGSDVTVVEESCEENGGAGVARTILAAEAVAAIGFLCTESLQQALPALAEAGIPAITLSVRSGILMEDALKKGWPFFRLAPAPAAEADKAVEIILRDWRAEPFALIDDGTIHARELVEAIRLKLEETGMKAVFVDTFRPAQEQQIALVRRLAGTGATRVFVGGDRTDTAIIARDAAAEGRPLQLLGGEALMAADQRVAMPDGVLAITLPPYEDLPEGREVAARMAETGLVAEGYVLPAHAAWTVAAKAAEVATVENRPAAAALLEGTFPTVIGTVGFGAGHELRQNPYRLLEWRQGAFRPAAGESQGQ
ncbi:ABC transporter substrate-binding protein [Rhizobium sp. TRM95111]|uniref:ABC transporter substrate-binding protein n=1 Tax=Rhizobium alarense TaxID=2846851 RepID=UPI001F2D0FEB|nr:ABC transporter substrate-binding protein [Rhizobium alarense]MCF3639037.1 ABC transporter substrate-binding protein [Rhizobium alarense]